MKTLAIILNYNTGDMTDKLYEFLSDVTKEICDLIVFDNNSKKQSESKYTNIKSKENLYWGGALNKAFDLVLNSDKYDSLIFINSDIMPRQENFLNNFILNFRNSDCEILSPSVNEFQHGARGGKNHDGRVVWKQMANWRSNKIRYVRMIDLQCPMFSKNIISKIKKFDSSLDYGYGQETLLGIFCESVGWKIGVDDRLLIDHKGQASHEIANTNEDSKANKTISALSQENWELYQKKHKIVRISRWYKNNYRRKYRYYSE
jgi:hypothetical protein